MTLELSTSGIGIRPELFESVFAEQPKFGFLEAHSENYFGESISRKKLLELRELYPVSLHGVGLSLGRADDLNQEHLIELRQLVDEVDPLFVSEHLSWSAYAHRHLPDLLPLPLNNDALRIMCEHVDRMQSFLGRQIFVENPSNYLLFEQLQIPEPEFLNSLAKTTGCGLLLDVNNVHVSAFNIGRDSKEYIDAIDSDAIGQYHLAGYVEVERQFGDSTETVLIDTHNQTVYDPVWELFAHTLKRHGARATLFEWDSDFPEFSVLLNECKKADKLLAGVAPAVVQRIDYQASANDSSLNLQAKSLDSQSLQDQQGNFLDQLLNINDASTVAKEQHKQRIWIYQNNVFGALQDYLSGVFEATLGLVGADFFKQMAQVYIQKNPPAEGNIHNYGHDFAQIVSEFEGLQNLPYLADVIIYEWALHRAYYQPLGQQLDPNEIDQEELLVMPVVMNDSVSLIETAYPIYEIHRQSLPDFEQKVSIDLNQSQDNVLVYKQINKVESKVVSDNEMRFLQELKKSSNLLQAIEQLQGSLVPEALSSSISLVFETQLLSIGNNS